jgi:hypothetical protein
LHDWLRRNGPLKYALARQVHQRLGYTSSRASLIVRLLSPLPVGDREKPGTYQELIGHLDHEELAVRQFAFWHLYEGLKQRMPDVVFKIEYDPMLPQARRQEGVAKWRKLIPAGTVPARPCEQPRP